MLDASAGFEAEFEFDAVAAAGVPFDVAVALVVAAGASPSGLAHTGAIAAINAANKTMAMVFVLRSKCLGI